MIECKKATIEFLVPYQQFAKAIEPTVCDFDDPATGFLCGITFEFVSLLPSSFDVGNVAVRFDDFQGRSSGVTRVSAQVLVSPQRGVVLLTTIASSTASNCETEVG